MAIFERRNDQSRSLGPQRSGGWRTERSCCLARNAAAWRQGKKIANEPLRVKVGERSEHIAVRDPPAKGRHWRGLTLVRTGRHRLKGVAPPLQAQVFLLHSSRSYAQHENAIRVHAHVCDNLATPANKTGAGGNDSTGIQANMAEKLT
jgi:hypothetical protein